MALNLPKKESASNRWYENNKQAVSEKRKKRYAEDAEYRQRIVEASRRRRLGEITPKTPPEDAPISFEQAAKRIGIGKTVLHDWHKKKYFPEPKRHNGRRLWFTEKQVRLLQYLKDRVHGRRRCYGKVDRFKDVIAYVHENWS
jgi:predicted DNA-binding transcriptional regulator AlpA